MFKDTPTLRAAMIKAVALGATHSQTWHTFSRGDWHLSSVAFYDLSAPCDVAGCRVEVATWQAGLESFSPLRRPSCYWEGGNADRSNREALAIPCPSLIPEDYRNNGEGAI